MVDTEDGGDAAERARRRQKDRQIYRVLREEQRRDRDEQDTVPAAAVGKRRPREQMYLESLSRYGVAVLTDMLTSGDIFRLVHERGWPVAYVEPLGGDTQEFVQAWFGLGWESFLGAVEKDRWDSTRSSLRTYFINLCIGRFGRHYRRWWSDRRRHVLYPEVPDHVVPDVNAEEMDRLEVLGELPRRVVTARVVDRATFVEIAKELDVDPAVVRSIWRQAIRRLQADDHDDRCGDGQDRRGDQ